MAEAKVIDPSETHLGSSEDDCNAFDCLTLFIRDSQEANMGLLMKALAIPDLGEV